ncbi:MAG: CbiX/SirB N-terminal domain-containing protein [Chloroflexota bacterium]
MSRTALVLAGHGSHISPETAGIVWQQVDQLRALNVADEVTAAFWKETPSFHQVIDTLVADDVTIVPLFTAQGYFTQTVIPAEMSLNGKLTTREGRTIRYTPTLSEHPHLSQIVRQRIQTALEQSGADPSDVAVAIIGHGTRRSPESRRATLNQADQVRDKAAESLAVFLDDSPSIPDIYRLTTRPVIIAVPFFLALGSHTTIDVPAELGLASGSMFGHVSGREVYYTLPVGVGADLDQTILELARDSGAPLREPSSAGQWDGFPTVGRDELIEAVRAAGWIEFGQLTLSLHEVRPTEINFEREVIEFSEPAALRDHVRREPFRPLSTSTDLPRDWVVRIEKRAQIHAVVETIYPGAVAEWVRRETLPITPLESLAARQTGMYRQIDQLSAERRAEIVAQVCGNCVRHPTWFDGIREHIPCAEACNFWMSRALKAETE